jgi:multidrug resistance efflux pump
VVELIVGTYGVLCWLLLVKFKVFPLNVYTIFTAMAGGVVILLVLYVLLSVFHPVSHDGRMYAPVVQIVPEVRGVVIDVPVVANQPLKQGDVLFRIEPRPFQFEIDRLQASLAIKNRGFAEDVDKLAAAEAVTKEARAKLILSESENGRQLREAYERAKGQTAKIKERLELAVESFDREKQLKASGAGAQQDYDRAQANMQSLEQELSKAEADQKIAEEQLKGGSAGLEADVQRLLQAEANERQARTRVNTRIRAKPKGKDPKEKGDEKEVTPEEREIQAQLDKARYDLDQTVVRAPSSGYVPQVVLRPGTMATATRLVPLMMFVAEERPTLVATYQQKVIANIKPGMEGEAVFKAYPGRSFKVKVRRVLTAVREGEVDASGQIITATEASEKGYIPVVFDYEEDIAGLNLPVGAQASIAVYTDRVHALSIVRKIIIRMKSWENYVF